jgi:hypothetical protein
MSRLSPLVGRNQWKSIRPSPAQAAGPIVKPLPADLFRSLGTNAETLWSSLKGQGYYVPVDRFFVRNHTVTPAIDASTWSLEISGSATRSAHFTLDDLKRLPSVTRPVAIECAGNGRGYFTTQQGQTVSGTAWRLGAIGVGKWKGVKLSTVLRKAGMKRNAVDVQPIGLDPNFVSGGADLGPVRRPFPVSKAFEDVSTCCWRGPRTCAATPSRTWPGSTLSVTCSTPPSACR